jgi:hypothetical protein
LRKKAYSSKEYDLADLPFNTDLRGRSHVDEVLRPGDLGKIAAKAAQGLLHGADGARGTGPFSSRKPQPHAAAQYTVKNRTKPFIWLHIHKAGGTFMCMLAQLAGENVVEPSDSACNWLWHDQYRDSGSDGHITCADRSAYMNGPENQYTWGQVEREFSESDRCWDYFAFGIMLREPISLLESEMNYHPGCWLFGGPCGGGPQHPRAFLATLNETLAKGREAEPNSGGQNQFPQWKFFDNVQTRLLAPALEVPPGQINATHLALANRALKRFTIVTRLEDFPKTAPRVFKQLGWNPGMVSHVGQPVNTNDHEFVFTDEEAAWLRHVNRYDVQLWETYAS